MTPLARSYLYVPGTEPRKMGKAASSGADAVILDLEDAVPAHRKQEARDTVREWVASQTGGTPELWVRVNAGPEGLAEVAELRDCAGLTGFVLAKADLAQVRAVARRLERTGLRLSPLLETAASVLDARQIAEVGIHLLQIGEYDLCADVGIRPGNGEEETAWARAAVVFASRAAGALPPVAPVSIEIRNLERFETSTHLAARQGFLGRACIHPDQVDVVNRVFTPTAEALDRARSTLERFAGLDGEAVMVDEDGRMVDEATIRSARRTLALAREPA